MTTPTQELRSQRIYDHMLDMWEYPCPQCAAMLALRELETDPANQYGFTFEQTWLIDAALSVLHNADEYKGIRTTLKDGHELWLHRCGRKVELNPWMQGRLQDLVFRRGDPKDRYVIAEDLGEVDAE